MKSRPGSAGKTSNKQLTPSPGRSKSGSSNNADIVCDVCSQVSMLSLIKLELGGSVISCVTRYINAEYFSAPVAFSRQFLNCTQL